MRSPATQIETAALLVSHQAVQRYRNGARDRCVRLFGQRRNLGVAQGPGIETEILDAAVEGCVAAVPAKQPFLVEQLTRRQLKGIVSARKLAIDIDLGRATAQGDGNVCPAAERQRLIGFDPLLAVDTRAANGEAQPATVAAC